jgi:hypothetical protein
MIQLHDRGKGAGNREVSRVAGRAEGASGKADFSVEVDL